MRRVRWHHVDLIIPGLAVANVVFWIAGGHL
jgi:hypothetical protein